AGYSPANKMAVIMIGGSGGIIKAVTMDSKGRAPRGDTSFKIGIKAKKGVVAAQTSKYSVKLNHGDFAQTLSASGLANADMTNAVAHLTIDVMFAGSIFETSQG